MHRLAQVWNAIIAERLSMRLIIVQARRALVGSLSEAVLVCILSDNEIYRYTHSLRTSPPRPAYDARSWSIEDSKGRIWRQNKSRCMEDDKKTATRNDLRVSTGAIYFARWSVNVIDGGQHCLASTALRTLPFRTSHVLRMRHMMRMRIQVDTTSCEYLYRHRYGWSELLCICSIGKLWYRYNPAYLSCIVIPMSINCWILVFLIALQSKYSAAINNTSVRRTIKVVLVKVLFCWHSKKKKRCMGLDKLLISFS